LFAWRTVTETREGRREAHAAHLEEIRQQRELLHATTSAHEREMAEREHASASELVFHRLVHMGRLIELLGETADIARFEIDNPLRGSPDRLAPGLA
jgi:hypothetical protein